MNPIPNSAIAMAIGLLVVIWAFLVHMVMSQADDAHLQFLLNLVADEEQPRDSSGTGSFTSVSIDPRMKTSHEAAQRTANAAEPQSLQIAWRKIPLLFT